MLLFKSALLSSASMHDSQAASSLAEITNKRVCNLYHLMDTAYCDAPGIHLYSRSLGHVPVIDINPRTYGTQTGADNKAPMCCYTVEQVNGRLKDEFEGCHLRVRGHAKVIC